MLSEIHKVLLPQGSPSLWTTLVLGGLLAAAGWVGAWCFARLWNRSYRLRLGHHLLCGTAAIITFAAVPVWTATSFVGNTIEAVDEAWREHLVTNKRWQREAFERAYEAVQRLGREDFSHIPPSSTGGSRIPLTDSASVRAVARAYVGQAASSLGKQYPQLEPLIRSVSAEAAEAFAHELRSLLESTDAIYSPGQAARQMASSVSAALLDPIRLWVWRTRLVVAGLFLAAQTLAFGAAGIAAARDLSIYT